MVTHMQTLIALYQQNPFWIWIAVGAIFVALDILAGSGRLIWPAVAAAILAFINLANERLGVGVELTVFLCVSVAGVGLSFRLGQSRPRFSAEVIDPEFRPGHHADAASSHAVLQPAAAQQTREAPQAVELAALNSQERSARLIGRIGRTTGEFINGVGRVWIDGSEWSAEVDFGDGELPAEAPVRVLGVTGGVRLRVQGLSL
jgi:membrane protein implicated in regulation of membrane protease activity